jgi:hypothetical protein
MSPADNTPDFDNMSPEEITAWMETLAERQGATQGFTTDDRMEIAEIDPDSIEDTGPGYIPFGMTEEDWAKKQADEEAEKAARLAERAAEPAPEAAPPEPVADPVPEPLAASLEPVAEAAPTAEPDMPDFDNMSPEEITAWMETLAERQGATIGFTTDTRMEIAEIDPDSIEDTGPGYIPFGMTEEDWAKKQADEEAEKAARLAERAAEPVAETVPEPEAVLPELVEEEAPPPPGEAQFELPELDLGQAEVGEVPTDTVPTTEGADMDWLGDLVPEEAGSFPEVDLSGLDQLDFGDLDTSLEALDLEQFAGEPAVQGSTDPMDWLENIAEAQGVSTDPTREIAQADMEAISGVTDPTTQADVDPLEWLESLAQQEGVSADELVTAADVDVPSQPKDAQADDYTDYSVEAEQLPALDTVDALDTAAEDDPAAWLDSLASSVGKPEEAEAPAPPPVLESIEEEEDEDAVPDTQEVMAALDKGISDPRDIEQWMSEMLEKGAARSDIPDYIAEEEEVAPAIEANIPDWLIEQVGGPPPDLSAPAEPEAPAVEPVVEEEAEVVVSDDEAELTPAEMPDWLADQLPEAPDADQMPLEELFADEAEPVVSDDEAELAPADMPDWLADESEKEPALEPEIPEWLQDSAPGEGTEEVIFVAEEAATPPPPVAEPVASIDSNDPWVKGFEIEQKEGLTDPNMVPDWYAAKLGGEVEATPAAAAAIPTTPAPELADASLPEETTLSVGELEMLPDWLAAAATEAPAPATPPPAPPTPEPVATPPEPEPVIEPAAAEMPDWLNVEAGEPAAVAEGELPGWLDGVGVDSAEEVPDWLLETVNEEQPVFVPPEVIQPPQPFTPPVAQPPVAPTPAAAPPTPPAADVVAALASAREKFGAKDIDGALADYESVIRANAALAEVVKDLAGHIDKKEYKEHASIYRVLGDAYMRQGSLQQALDTYRKALNLL